MMEWIVPPHKVTTLTHLSRKPATPTWHFISPHFPIPDRVATAVGDDKSVIRESFRRQERKHQHNYLWQLELASPIIKAPQRAMNTSTALLCPTHDQKPSDSSW